jgi:hypothetical protein
MYLTRGSSYLLHSKIQNLVSTLFGVSFIYIASSFDYCRVVLIAETQLSSKILIRPEILYGYSIPMRGFVILTDFEFYEI